MRRWMAATVLVVVCGVAAAEPSAPQVTTSLGVATGVDEAGIRIFRGVPYAAPPVGEGRWRAPAPSEPWQGARDASAYGPVCPQMRPTALPQDEDCLTLNVWAPAETAAAGAPVMVWIHGGAYVNGSGRIDGSRFARDGVVLVTINYRLGQLGVFAHPELVAPETDEVAGNFGLMDQIAALRWVQREIGAFGGDPGRVTIFGVSAGAGYVNALMASPLARGLFHRAIAQSGGNGLSRMRELPPLERAGVALAERHEVAGVAGLRTLPWRDIVENSDRYRLESVPVVDGVTLVEDLGQAFAAGRQANVPYIAGANSFEGSLAAAIPIPAFERVLDADRERIAGVYGRAPDDRALSLEFYGDMLFVAPGRYLARQMGRVPAPAWLYHFDYVLEVLDAQVPGARHGGEVPYVFDAVAEVVVGPDAPAWFGLPEGRYVPTAADQQVAATVHGYWVQFARTGSPNREGLPVWPAYDGDADPALTFANEGVAVRAGLYAERLDLIEAGYASQRREAASN